MNRQNTNDKLVEIEYVDNNRIQVLHLNGVSRDAIDEYMRLIQSEMLDMEGSLLLSVHDYSQIGGTITPYFIGRIREVAANNTRTDMYGRVAMVTSMDIFRLLMNPLMKVFSRENHKVAIKFFSTVDEAVSWVSTYQE